MSPKEFARLSKNAARFIQHDLPRIVGVEATNHFQESFQNEGFTDVTLQKWTPLKPSTLKRKQTKKGNVAKILTESGDLADSLRWDADYNSVTISTDKEYAQVHNEGGRAGRGKGFIMPKRQFMGRSVQLEEKITEKVTAKLQSIFS